MAACWRLVVLSGVWLYDAHTFQEVALLSTGYTDSVRLLSFSPDGQTLAGGVNGSIRLWNVDTGKLQKILTGHTERININSVCFSPDGQLLASGDWDNSIGGWDNSIRLWNVDTGKLQKNPHRTH